MSIDLRKYETAYTLSPIKRGALFYTLAILFVLPLFFDENAKIVLALEAVISAALGVVNAIIALYRINKYKSF